MTDWYATQSGAGSADGTSLADAWAVGSIVWGVGGVVAGDALILSGTISNATNTATFTPTISVGAGGTEGSPITIKGSPDDPAIITSSTTDIVGTTGDWADQTGNVWRRDTTGINSKTHITALIFDGRHALYTGDVAGTATKGRWNSPTNLAVDVYSTTNPASVWTEILLVHDQIGFEVDGYDYIDFDCTDIEFHYFSRAQGREFDDQGAITLLNAERINVYSPYGYRTGNLVTVGGGCDNVTVFNPYGVQMCTQHDRNTTKGGSLVTSSSPRTRVYNPVANNEQKLADSEDLVRLGMPVRFEMTDDVANSIAGCEIHGGDIRGFASGGLFMDNWYTGRSADVVGGVIADGKYIGARFGDGDADGIALGGSQGGAPTTYDYWMQEQHFYRNFIKETPNCGIHHANYHGGGSEVVGNIVVDPCDDTDGAAQAGMRISNGATAAQNTVIGPTSAAGNAEGIKLDRNATVVSREGAGLRSYAYNNIVMDWPAGDEALIADAVDDGVAANNCLHGNSTVLNITNTNGITDDPLFRDATNDDYRLNGGSPCIGAGVEWWTGEPPTGYDGKRFCLPPSIGAFEYYGGGTAAGVVARVLPAGVDIAKAKAA